jgi:hypothetical protein
VALVVREKWASDRGLCLSKEVVSQVAASPWYGTANVLSPEHGVDWPVIDQVTVATTNPGIAAVEEFSRFPSEEELFGAPVRSGAFTAEKVILGRRSAVSMDASTAIPAATFFRMLARLVPTRDPRCRLQGVKSVPGGLASHDARQFRRSIRRRHGLARLWASITSAGGADVAGRAAVQAAVAISRVRVAHISFTSLRPYRAKPRC